MPGDEIFQRGTPILKRQGTQVGLTVMQQVIGADKRRVAFHKPFRDCLPVKALLQGIEGGDAFAVLSLGRGGEVVLRVDVADGPGPDLAVFENGFSDGFLELARVEVSSDGTTFVPFPGVSRTEEPVGAYAPLDPSLVHGFAGTWRQGLGTAFDLGLLHQHPLVRAGQVDLQRIRFVKVVDLVGDGSELDAMGRPVYDPFPTVGSAGFDLDAIAVLEAP